MYNIDEKVNIFLKYYFKGGLLCITKEEKTLQVEVPKKAFFTIDEEGNSIADGTGAKVFVGFGQPDARTYELTGKKVEVIEL